MDYIAAGEAPEEIRNVLRQRSRWTKGHYQVFFSRRNSLINWDLPFFQRLWYAYAAWSPFCTTLTVPGFMVAPLISVIWGIHPLVINYNFVLYSTIYFFIQMAIQVSCAPQVAVHTRLRSCGGPVGALSDAKATMRHIQLASCKLSQCSGFFNPSVNASSS